MKFELAPGETLNEALQALRRVVRRMGQRAVLLKRKHARDPENKQLIENYLQAAQEYYYVAALASEFGDSVVEAVGVVMAENDEKKNTMN